MLYQQQPDGALNLAGRRRPQRTFFLAIGDQYGWNFSSMEAETAGTALADLIPEDVYNYSYRWCRDR